LTTSGRDIAKLSVIEDEEEILLLPYSCLDVIEVTDLPGQPLYVKLREVHIPRSLKVLFWVDDNPENNLKFMLESERRGVSVVCCTTTKNALRVMKDYLWLAYIKEADFRVVTDMVRDEEGDLVLDAGIRLVQSLREDLHYTHPILIYCGDTKKAHGNCVAKGFRDNIFISSLENEVLEFISFKPI